MECENLAQWQNPKNFLPLLLYFGIFLVVSGTGIQWFTANPAIETYGWIVVAVAIVLWLLKEFKHKL
jgi:hypothetical protein